MFRLSFGLASGVRELSSQEFLRLWSSTLAVFHRACVFRGDERHANLKISVCGCSVLVRAARHARAGARARGRAESSRVQSDFPRKAGNADDPAALSPGGNLYPESQDYGK